MFDDLLPDTPRLAADQPRILIVIGEGEEDEAREVYGDLEEAK